jgi:hypothetical protein
VKYISGKYNPYYPLLSLAKTRIAVNVAMKTEVLHGKSTAVWIKGEGRARY